MEKTLRSLRLAPEAMDQANGILAVFAPEKNDYPCDPDAYVEDVRMAKEPLAFPIVASMNGTSKGGWLKYARMISKAGADGLELYLYFLPASDTCMGMDIKNLYFDVLKTVADSVDIPIAVKLSPLADIRGSFSLLEQVEPTAYERAGYVKLLQSYGRI